MKQCSKCFIEKSFDEFSLISSNSDKTRSECKECRKKYSSQWYQNNKLHKDTKDKIWRAKNLESVRINGRKRSLKWAKQNKEKVLAKNQKRRLNEKQTEQFFISKKFIENLYSSECVVCGSRENIQMDHIVPITRGGTHSEGNLQPLCRSCNSSKKDKTMTEWL